MIENVLVVDDSLTCKTIIMRILTEEFKLTNDQITYASNGREALDQLEENQYSIVFMDWYMPYMSGLEAITSIRTRDQKTPIIMITSEFDQEAVSKAIQAGANNYIVKP